MIIDLINFFEICAIYKSIIHIRLSFNLSSKQSFLGGFIIFVFDVFFFKQLLSRSKVENETPFMFVWT
jgi:hypothetical protein